MDSPCGQPTWTSAGDHHLRWLNLQEKVGRGTLDLELSLDSYSGAPRGPRASPGPHLGLQRNVTNLLALRTRCLHPSPDRRGVSFVLQPSRLAHGSRVPAKISDFTTTHPPLRKNMPAQRQRRRVSLRREGPTMPPRTREPLATTRLTRRGRGWLGPGRGKRGGK